MTIKTVVNVDAGTTDLVGGNDWDNLATAINLGEGYTYLVRKSGSTYYIKNSVGESIHSGTNARTEIQWAIDNVPSEGGQVLLAPNTTFDLGSAAANGLTLEQNKTKHVDLLGSGLTTIIQYTGTGSGIYVTNTVAASSFPNYRIGNFTLTAVASPYSASGTTISAGRNGIFIDTTYGIAELDHIWMRQFDDAITIKNTEFGDIHNITIKTCNNGILTTGVLATNTISGVHIHDCSVDGCFEYGINYNSGASTNFETGTIDHCSFDNCILACIRVDSYGNEFVISDCYFESVTAANEAIYGAETAVHVYLAGDASFPMENVVLRNLHMGGLENTDNAIKVESCKDLTIDHCDAKGFRNALVLINTTNANTYMTIRNPKLRAYPNLTNIATPWLIDVPSDSFLGTIDSRLAGTVETNRGRGIIIVSSSGSLVLGDVVVYSAAANAFVGTSTTADNLRPAVIMYPPKQANRPCVIAISGIHKVNVDAAATFGDTLTSSSSSKKAKVNNAATDPKIVLGYLMGNLAATGLQYARIL